MNPMRCWIVSEFSLPSFLWSVLVGRQPVVVYVLAVYPPFQGLLDRLMAAFVARGKARWADQVAPSANRHLRFVRSWTSTFLYHKTEEWLRGYYGFAADAAREPYAFALHKTICNHYIRRLNLLTVVQAVVSDLGGQSVRVVGGARDLESLYAALWGTEPRLSWRHARVPHTLLNTVHALVMAVYSLAWIASRVRLTVDRQHFRLGMDYVQGNTTLLLARELVDDSRQTAFFFRNKEMERQYRPQLAKEFSTVAFHAAALRPVEAVGQAGRLLARLAGLLWRHGGKLPDLFYQLAKFPFHQVVFRATFNRFDCDVFLARDDYNVEHVFRTAELRRRGIGSFGVCHGSNYIPILDPATRYVDFDTYFTFGSAIYERHYRDTFPAGMTVQMVCCYGLDRQELAHFLPTHPGPGWQPANRELKDIACFTKPHIDGNDVLAGAVRLAREFPDRTIWVKVKLAAKDRGGFEDFLEALGTVPTNVVYTEENSYDLIKRVGWTLNGASTLVEECLGLGLRTLILDTYPERYPLFWREFPAVCLKEMDHIIEIIRQDESGDKPFPWDEISGMADQSGEVVYDVMRRHMGLPPARA